MRDSILDLFRQNPEKPYSKTQLLRALKLASSEKGDLTSGLESLTDSGELILGTKSLYRLSEAAAPAKKSPTKKSVSKKSSTSPRKGTLTGSIKFLPNGHAFFYPIIGDPANEAVGIDFTVHSRIFIPRGSASTALDGDSVKIIPAKPSLRTDRGGNSEEEIRGEVTEIISRRSGRIVGIFRKKGKTAYAETDDKALDGRIFVTGDTTAEPGQTVVVDMEKWDDPKADPSGRIVEVLGWPGDAGVDILSTIARFALRTSFPENVLQEARAIPEEISPAELARRADHRKKLVITIDPFDAKDHDDAIYIAKTRAGGWLLEVHIADVSHYIKPGSPMDVEARERGNSTYLVDRVLPMLPTELSNGICSLKPDVDRLTKCAVIEISAEGKVINTRFIDAVIHSRAKLSYEMAQDILDGKPAPKGSDPTLPASIREAWKMASLLRKNRFENGALDLEMSEIKIKLDEEGRAADAVPVIHTESHQLVEECMLIANEAVAKVLREGQKPCIYRIHEDPDPSRLLDYTETAIQHGYKPGDLTNRRHIQELLDSAKGSPEEHTIKLGLLKSLKRAAYSPDPLGHYGLAKNDYTHFTSPIRRYADLIVHRALQKFLTNAPKNPDRTPPQSDLGDIARHISDTERTSSEAESETKQIKLLEYLELVATTDQSKDSGQETTFDGVITDARAMGLMVEIPNMNVRGVIKREDLPSGSRWRFEAHNNAWTSYDGQRLAMGMKLPLRIIGIDKIKRFVDFAAAGPPTTAGVKPNSTSRASGKRQKEGSRNSKPKTATKKRARSTKRSSSKRSPKR